MAGRCKGWSRSSHPSPAKVCPAVPPSRDAPETGGAMRNILGILMIGLLLTTSLGKVSADPLEDGIAAYQRGDFAAALRLFQPLAEQGDASAQSNLGVMYEQGRGVAQNYREAMRLFRLAAIQGDASAQSRCHVLYGTRYRPGLSRSDEVVSARRWTRQRRSAVQSRCNVRAGDRRPPGPLARSYVVQPCCVAV